MPDERLLTAEERRVYEQAQAEWDAAHPKRVSVSLVGLEAYPKLLFIKYLLEGKNQSEAMRLARPDMEEGVVRQMASVWANDPEIVKLVDKARVVQLRAVGVDASWALKEVVDAYHISREKDDMKNALRSLELIVKHTGGFEKGTPGGNTFNGPVQFIVKYEKRGELPSVTRIEVLPQPKDPDARND